MIDQLKLQFETALRGNVADGMVILQEFALMEELKSELYRSAIKAWKLAGQTDGEYTFHFEFVRNDQQAHPQMQVKGIAYGASEFSFDHNFIFWTELTGVV